jgi:Uma2 family endonuclease
MAEPVRKRPPQEIDTPDEVPSTFIRWVEGPDGRFEPRDFPLTPEDFLDPQIGDTMVQGRRHSRAVLELAELIRRHLLSRPDALVMSDVKHLIEPGRGPSPDISVLLGAQDIDDDWDEEEEESYDMARHGIAPSLIIEVVSPKDSRIRKVDEVDKVGLYARVGVKEYILEDTPRRATGWCYRLRGYRLDARGRYQDIRPDDQGRLLSETTGLLFGVSVQGDRIEVFDASTGERILYPLEIEQARTREEYARKAAEAEVARLRREIERLRGEG